MLYSSWKMRLSARGLTLPWQLVELQEPGPVYLLVSAGAAAADATGSAVETIALHRIARRSGRHFPPDLILIRSLGCSVPPAAPASDAGARRKFFITPLARSQRIVARQFPKIGRASCRE